jgi:hypothetical protein
MNNNNNTMNFNTLKNKEFLWKIMYENGVFKNLDNSLSGNIQMFLDNKMKNIDMKKTASDTLISLNKRVINEMNNDIKSRNFMSVVKMQEVQQAQQAQQGQIQGQIRVPMPLEGMITSQEIFQNRQNVFDQQLKNMKNDFDSLISVSKPDVIDFSDNNKKNNSLKSSLETIPEENIDIERLLAETISKRENLVITLNENEKISASKWVNNNREVIPKVTAPLQQQQQQQRQVPEQQPYKPLKIGEEIDVELLENYGKSRKNVTFNDDLNNFIPAIDVEIENDNNDIDDRLNKIDDKLNKIMDMLLGIKNYQQQDISFNYADVESL